MSNTEALLELAAEYSALQGHVVTDWQVNEVPGSGWILGARGLRGAFNLVVDEAGNIAAYHLKSPADAFDGLAREVSAREPASAPGGAEDEVFGVDRLGWDLVFRRSGRETRPEVWSVAEGGWRPTVLLELVTGLPLVALDDRELQNRLEREPWLRDADAAQRPR